MFLLLLLSVIIFPFLTYSISTNIFYRRANSKALGKRPPTIPYFVPGAFHIFTLAYDGSRKYFATLIKQYGNFAPFLVKAGNRSFVVVRNPDHLKTLMLASKPPSSIDFHDEMIKKLLAVPEVERDDGSWKETMRYTRSVLPQKYLTGPPLASITSIYVSILSSNLNNKMFQVGTWTQIEDFMSFFQQVVTRCAVETLFGSAIFKQYSSLVKDFQKFADSVDDFMPGMPAFIMSTAYKGPRDRLLEGIERWLEVHHTGLEFARTDDGDPVRDDLKGSKFIQERDSVIAKLKSVNPKARAAELLLVLLGLNSRLVPTAFWTIIDTLREPHIHENLMTEISQFFSPQSGEYDMARIAKIPIVQSVQAETRRLRRASVVTRKNELDGFQLDERWVLPKGAIVTIFSHDFSMNADLWASVRPRAMDKPLNEFWAERFLVPDPTKQNTKQNTNRRDKIDSRKFSLDGLESWNLIFDDELLGREFTDTIQAATLAIFLTQFELQLCDPEVVDELIPSIGEVAYGTVKPLERIAVRIRKRRLDN